MSTSSTLDRIHLKVRNNRWLRYFAVFNRVALALGFLPSGFVKVRGERLTALSVEHPMGHYLDAFYQTGFYYPFVGVLQMTAAILLLIPRTATLGALIYFPVILNICILSFAVRFEGSLLTSPLMVLANLYLLCWDYHKLKFILPFNHLHKAIPGQKYVSNKFPKFFFAGVAATVFIVVVIIAKAYNIMPRNTLSECKKQCEGNDNSSACYDFCECIHIEAQPLEKCLDYYNSASEDPVEISGND